MIARTHSEEETAEIARRLAGRLPRSAVVLLYGELGAGKTAFVRGLVAGVGGEADEVNSPTFALIQEYPAPRPVHHVDLYRLTGAETDDLGLDELSEGPGLVAIEWADRLGAPIPGAFVVHIDDRGGDEREIRIEEPADTPAPRNRCSL